MTDLTPTQIARIAVAAKKAIGSGPPPHIGWFTSNALLNRVMLNEAQFIAICDPASVLALCEMARAHMKTYSEWPCATCGGVSARSHYTAPFHGYTPASFTEVIAGEGGRT